MISQLEYASKHFEKVYYVTRTLENDNRDQVRADNVEVVDAGHFKLVPASLGKMRGVFADGGGKDFVRAMRDGAFGRPFLRSSFINEFASTCLFKESERILSKLNPARTVIFSTWFLTEAIAASRVKRTHPDIRSVSFAHSFELQTQRNRMIDYQRIEFRHSNIDEIHFISKKVYEEYLASHMIPLDIPSNNCDVTYLGSRRPLSPGAGLSDAGPLRIVSCSSMVEVKRMDLLVEALSLLVERGIDFRWTHLGSGPLDGVIKDLAYKLIPRERFDFKGYYPNIAVHEYYRDNPVDLFVNVSAMEGLPVSLMEAASYGIPCVATDVGGSSEIVHDGENGFLLPADPTPNDVVEVLARYACMPLTCRRPLGENARALWSREFDAASNADALYSRLAES